MCLSVCVVVKFSGWWLGLTFDSVLDCVVRSHSKRKEKNTKLASGYQLPLRGFKYLSENFSLQNKKSPVKFLMKSFVQRLLALTLLKGRVFLVAAQKHTGTKRQAPSRIGWFKRMEILCKLCFSSAPKYHAKGSTQQTQHLSTDCSDHRCLTVAPSSFRVWFEIQFCLSQPWATIILPHPGLGGK